MRKALATILVSILGIALLIYTAYRSYSFISLTLPADKQILAIFALFALDGGMLLWLANFLWGAQGGFQRAICLLMTVVDLLGSTILATVDTVYNTGESGMTVKMDANQILFAAIGMGVVILLNVAATVMFHLFDPDARKRGAEQEAQDNIEEKALKHVEAASERLAAKLAPEIAQNWYDDMEARYMANLNIFGDKDKSKSFRGLLNLPPPTTTGNTKTKREEVPSEANAMPPLPLLNQVKSPQKGMKIPALDLFRVKDEDLEVLVENKNGNGNHKSAPKP